jgi:predicted membrane channel-forming protein YqfA (hemolysin III family)
MSGEWWGFIFLMLIMKVPIAYLAGVVWYACKPPDPPEPAVKLVEEPEPEPRCPWRVRRRHPIGPRGTRLRRRPVRRPTRVSHAYAERK